MGQIKNIKLHIVTDIKSNLAVERGRRVKWLWQDLWCLFSVKMER